MMQVRMKSLRTDVTGPSPVALAEAPALVPSQDSGLQGVAASRNVWVTTKQSCVALLTHLSLAWDGRGDRGEGMGKHRRGLVVM
jgi:hypothetical protein